MRFTDKSMVILSPLYQSASELGLGLKLYPSNMHAQQRPYAIRAESFSSENFSATRLIFSLFKTLVPDH